MGKAVLREMKQTSNKPPKSEARAEATVAFFAYNHEAFVEKALTAILQQEHCLLEIVLLDDASRDQTVPLIERIVSEYRGPHSLRLVRNTDNQGFAHQVNQAFELASTEVVIFAAGDDVSLPSRARKIIHAFNQAGEKAACVWSNAQIVDEHDRFQRLFLPADEICRHNAQSSVFSASHYPWVLGATSAYRKNVFSAFGPLDKDIMQEDLALALRSRLIGTVLYLPELLVSYRRHSANAYSYESHDCEAALGKQRSRLNERALRRQARSDLQRARNVGRIRSAEMHYYNAMHAYRRWCAALDASQVARNPIGRRILHRLLACNRVFDGVVRSAIRLN